MIYTHAYIHKKLNKKCFTLQLFQFDAYYIFVVIFFCFCLSHEFECVLFIIFNCILLRVIFQILRVHNQPNSSQYVYKFFKPLHFPRFAFLLLWNSGICYDFLLNSYDLIENFVEILIIDASITLFYYFHLVNDLNANQHDSFGELFLLFPYII